MDPRNPPPGTQVIGAGDAETLPIDDPGGEASEPGDMPDDAYTDTTRRNI